MPPAILFLLLAAPPAAAEDPPDAAAIMAKVAANVESAAEERRLYVYRQLVRSSMVRSDGNPARREVREYSVFPGEKATEKKLLNFSGAYRKGKQMIPYTDPHFRHKDTDLDGELIEDLTEDLVNDKESRDGIPHGMFPLRSKVLHKYVFTWAGESVYKGRKTWQIAFAPNKKPTLDEDDDAEIWKGDVWIDAEEFQPVRMATDLAWKIPVAVRLLLGTNLRRTGFSVSYVRVAPNVWFPETYGTEFRLNVLWGYKRTVTLSLESSGFQKTEATSHIEYDTAAAAAKP